MRPVIPHAHDDGSGMTTGAHLGEADTEAGERRPAASARPRRPLRRITGPGIVLGLALGGFVDGIVLHQVLQWHHMRTGDGALGERSMKTVGGLEANTLADGLFHVGTWVLLLAGLFWLWQVVGRDGARWSPRELTGLLLAGWGIFDVVEGIVDHEILGIHHVRDDLGGPIAWDLGFLAFGALLVVAGALLARTRAHEPTG
jgi:uncharacterized membrane protein